MVKRAGRIALWVFAGLGFLYSVAFAADLIHDNTPLGCYVAKRQVLIPGSEPDKAAKVVLARAIRKYPDIDFSKQWVEVINLEIPATQHGKDPFWIVAYREPPLTNIFGCHRETLRGIQGTVRKGDLILEGDVGPEGGQVWY